MTQKGHRRKQIVIEYKEPKVDEVNCNPLY